MRSLCVILSALLAVAGTARAADDDAKTILEKAIKAHGGADNLTKFKGGSMKGKGKVVTQFGELEFTQETTYMMPDKFKEVAEVEVMGTKIKTTTRINGDKTVFELNDKEVPLPDEVKTAVAEGKGRLAVARLVPLRDKKYELSVVGDAKVLDKPAVGIRVTAKGMKDVNLFFDKKSHLLVKIEAQTVDPTTKQEVTEERILSDYKKVDGLLSPGKAIINRDGKKYMEMTIEETKYLEKVDDEEFKK